jgi:CubicO group peptidase (beta-lactamase class C family)
MIRHTTLCALAVLAACNGPAPQGGMAADTARIARVVRSLRPGFAIAGETPVRWTLAERMAHFHVPGVSVAVIDSGRIVWARGFGVKEAGGTDSVTTATLFQAGSISKPVFALGVMRLVQDGVLDLDQDVNTRLSSWKVPENRFTATEKVTLRRILSHNAGLTVHGFPGYEPGVPVPTVPQVLDGTPPANTAPIRVDTFPGAISRYSGGGTTVAMLLVTDVTGKPFPAFMKETVLDPAGMTHSTYAQPLPADLVPLAATGHRGNGELVKGRYNTYPEMSAAGLWTTPSDLATLALALQRTHAGRDSAVIRPATLQQMFTVQKAPYGIGWALEGTGPDLVFEHNGADEGFLSAFEAFAERGQGAVIQTNGDNGGALMGEIMNAIADAYGWPTHRPSVRTAVSLPEATLAGLAGRYDLDVGEPKPVRVVLQLERGRLMTSVPGEENAQDELVAESDSTFFARQRGFRVRFVRNGRGEATGFTAFGDLHARKVR